MRSLHLVLLGPPRTKKTSQRVVWLKRKNTAPGQKQQFPKILPSEQYEHWFKNVMTYAPIINRQVANMGIALPITGPVGVTALFFREANQGDLTGFMQAVADAIQTPVERHGKQVRNGLGIIEDDAQIVSWDGSRLLKDAANPRIELDVVQLQGSLLDTEPELAEATL